MKSLDQTCPTSAYAPDSASKLQNKSRFRGSILEEFRKMGMLMNGVPSEATLCRIEQGIDELSMADRMREFAQTFHARLRRDNADTEIICVDGKAERGTVLENGSSPDIVSASFTKLIRILCQK